MEARKHADVVELGEAPALPKICCATCPHYGGADESKRAQIQKVGGTLRGDCNLQPTPVKKEPRDVCGQHPENQAKHLAAAFGPLVDRFAAVLSGGKR